MIKKREFDDEVAKLLKTVIDHFEQEDSATRLRQLKLYRKLKLYWNNLSLTYWNEGAKDYRIATPEESSDDQAFYDRPMNVFKAFLETIIAALSIQIPTVICVPGDAENSMDVMTAKVGNKIAERLYKDNEATLIWLKMLYVWVTEGMVACHHYPKEDEKYGTYEEPKYKDKEVETYSCPSCGAQLPDDIFGSSEDGEVNKFNENEDEGEAIELDITCPECQAELDPEMDKIKMNIPELDKFITKKNSRIKMEVYGGLYVKIANYAMTQAETPYLFFSHEVHYSQAVAEYPDLRDKLKLGNSSSLGGSYDPYEVTARLNPQFAGDWPDNTVTERKCWLRPESFNVLPVEGCEKLDNLFPDGAKVCLVNDICVEYKEEKLDDRWTLTKNPTGEYLTHQPLGELLINVQDIINDLISLALQLVEHGIIETWADPSVVNFSGRQQLESTPGAITAVKAQGANKNISDAFFSNSAAVLNPEIFTLFRIVQEMGQFVSAAMPSLFGGSQLGRTSQTASEYSMSKAGALQRLQTPWRTFSIFWKEIFTKIIPQDIAERRVDEKYVERDENNNFINIFIRKSDLAGKIGDVILDPSDQMPVSDDQKRDFILELMKLNNEEIMTALASPENLPMVRKVVRIPEFKLPGEADRQKQYEELRKLFSEEPIMGEAPPIEVLLVIDQPPSQDMMPSVPIDIDLDNHMIEAETCREVLISDAGRLAKEENPKGYQNALLHYKAHMQQVMMQQAAAAQAAQNSSIGKKESSRKAPEVNPDGPIR
jgi:ssDNA-binding Zn-finger/Zn-ribbon topoisomerase 1